MAALTGCSGGLTAAGVAAEAEHDSGGEQQGRVMAMRLRPAMRKPTRVALRRVERWTIGIGLR
jgi:hypothetical protein